MSLKQTWLLVIVYALTRIAECQPPAYVRSSGPICFGSNDGVEIEIKSCLEVYMACVGGKVELRWCYRGSVFRTGRGCTPSTDYPPCLQACDSDKGSHVPTDPASTSTVRKTTITAQGPQASCLGFPDRTVHEVEPCASLYVECLSGHSLLKWCSDGRVFSASHRMCVDSLVCASVARTTTTTTNAPTTKTASGFCSSKRDGYYPTGACTPDYMSCWNGELTESQCPYYLVFNPRSRACDYRQYVEWCPPETTSAAPTTPMPTTVPTTTTSTTTTTATTTESTTLSAGMSFRVCPIGKAVAKGNCNVEYGCKDMDGSTTTHWCLPGHVLSPTLLICKHRSVVSECKSPISSITTTTKVEFNRGTASTIGKIKKNVCAHQQGEKLPSGVCKQEYIECIDGAATLRWCPSGTVFDEMLTTCADSRNVRGCSPTVPPTQIEEATPFPPFVRTNGGATRPGSIDGRSGQPTPFPPFVRTNGAASRPATMPSHTYQTTTARAGFQMTPFPPFVRSITPRGNDFSDVVTSFPPFVRSNTPAATGHATAFPPFVRTRTRPVPHLPLPTTTRMPPIFHRPDPTLPSFTTPPTTEIIRLGDHTKCPDRQPNGIFGVGDCSRVFVHCMRGRPTKLECERGRIFNEQTQQCNLRADVPSCRRSGGDRMGQHRQHPTTTMYPPFIQPTMTSAFPSPAYPYNAPGDDLRRIMSSRSDGPSPAATPPSYGRTDDRAKPHPRIRATKSGRNPNYGQHTIPLGPGKTDEIDLGNPQMRNNAEMNNGLSNGWKSSSPQTATTTPTPTTTTGPPYSPRSDNRRRLHGQGQSDPNRPFRGRSNPNYPNVSPPTNVKRDRSRHRYPPPQARGSATNTRSDREQESSTLIDPYVSSSNGDSSRRSFRGLSPSAMRNRYAGRSQRTTTTAPTLNSRSTMNQSGRTASNSPPLIDCSNKADGHFPDPTGRCYPHYLVCYNNEYFVQSCPIGLRFDSRLKVCERPATIEECSRDADPFTSTALDPVPTPAPFRCPKDYGDYADPARPCSKHFFWCQAGDAKLTTCRRRGYIFDDDRKVCQHRKEVQGCSERKFYRNSRSVKK